MNSKLNWWVELVSRVAAMGVVFLVLYFFFGREAKAEVSLEVDEYGEVRQIWSPSDEGDGWVPFTDEHGRTSTMTDYGHEVVIEPRDAPGHIKRCMWSEAFGFTCY